MLILIQEKEWHCHPNYHMTLNEYAIWTYAHKVCEQSKRLQIGARALAAAFCELSKDVAMRTIKNLTAKGWFIEVTPSMMSHDGRVPAVLRPISHFEFQKTHRDQCEAAVNRWLQSMAKIKRDGKNSSPKPDARIEFGSRHLLQMRQAEGLESHVSSEGQGVQNSKKTVQNANKSNLACPSNETERQAIGSIGKAIFSDSVYKAQGTRHGNSMPDGKQESGAPDYPFANESPEAAAPRQDFCCDYGDCTTPVCSKGMLCQWHAERTKEWQRDNR